MSALTPRPGIMKIAPYVPGKDSVDGKEPIAKLSSNEGALGPSPKAMAAYAKAAAELHRYPDGATDQLREGDRPALRPRRRSHRLRLGLGRAAEPAGARLLRAGRRAALQPVRLPDVSDQRARRRRHAGRRAGEGLPRRRRCDAGQGHRQDARRVPRQSQQSDRHLRHQGRRAPPARRPAEERAAGDRRGLCRVRQQERLRIGRRAGRPGRERGDDPHLLEDLRHGRAAARLDVRPRPASST